MLKLKTKKIEFLAKRSKTTLFVILASFIFIFYEVEYLSAHDMPQTLRIIHERDNINSKTKKGKLNCGVHIQSDFYEKDGVWIRGLPGFASTTSDKPDNYVGLDVDFCKAVGAAIFGDDYKDHIFFKQVPNGRARFDLLADGDIDILARNTTHNLFREGLLGFTFVGANYIDEQRILYTRECFPNDQDVYSFLDGKMQNVCEKTGELVKICLSPGTTSEEKFKAKFDRVGQDNYRIINDNENLLELMRRFECHVISSDWSSLAAIKTALLETDQRTDLWIGQKPELRLGLEPLGPLVRRGDERWAKIVKWVLFALINAEDMEINKNNVEEKRQTSTDIHEQIFLGMHERFNFGDLVGLPPDWAFRIIKNVGNFEDMFRINIEESLGIVRKNTYNKLYKDKGAIYAPPFGIDDDQIILGKYVVDNKVPPGGVNMRNGPGAGYKVIRSLRNGDVLSMLMSEGLWAKFVLCEEPYVVGWVNSDEDYLKPIRQSETEQEPSTCPNQSEALTTVK